jgi:putative endonuclease
MRGGVCAVYILTNPANTVLYTGVTSDLEKRVAEHRIATDPNSFTSRYSIFRLVYYEVTPDIRAAIAREKQIKAGSRKKKKELIESMNPAWEDLSRGWQSG